MGLHYILDNLVDAQFNGMDAHISDSGNTWDADGLGPACSFNSQNGIYQSSGAGNAVDTCADFGYPANGAFQIDFVIGDSNTTQQIYTGATSNFARNGLLRLSNVPDCGFEMNADINGLKIYHVTGFNADGPTLIYSDAVALAPATYSLLFTPDGKLTVAGRVIATGLAITPNWLFYIGGPSGGNEINFIKKLQVGQWDGTQIINPDAPPAPAPAPSGGSSASDPQWAKFRTDLVNHRWKY